MSHELGDGHFLGAGKLDRGVQRRGDGDIRQAGGHVVSRQRLHGGRREPNGVAFGPRVGDPAEELEELRGPDDRYGTLPALIKLSWLTFARMYPLSAMRSAPTTDSAT